MSAHDFAVLLWRDLLLFLLFGAVLGMLLGLLLVFRPGMVERINRVASRWISTRHVYRWLDHSISIERWFYRNHRPAGILIMLGALYILVYFGLVFDKAHTLQQLGGRFPARLLAGLLDALVLFALMGGLFSLLAGLLIWLRPSLLRGLEKESNQWVSLRRPSKVLEVPHDQVDKFVARHAYRVGWLLFLASLYLIFILLRSLL